MTCAPDDFFADNQIECFLELSESDVKELVKPLGIVKKIIRIVQEVNCECEVVVVCASVIYQQIYLISVKIFPLAVMAL